MAPSWLKMAAGDATYPSKTSQLRKCVRKARSKILVLFQDEGEEFGLVGDDVGRVEV